MLISRSIDVDVKEHEAHVDNTVGEAPEYEVIKPKDEIIALNECPAYAPTPVPGGVASRAAGDGVYETVASV